MLSHAEGDEMVLSVKQWKQKKAKTLIGESVTPALTAVVAEAAKYAKSPAVSREQLSAYGGSIQSLRVAIDKTKAKCNKTLHGDTIKYLDAMDKEAQTLRGIVAKEQQAFMAALKEFQKTRDDVANALDTVMKNPLPKAMQDAMQVMINANKTLPTKFISVEIQAILQQIAGAQVILKEMLKAQPEPKQAGGRALPATPKDLAPQLADFANRIKRVKMPGGYIADKTMDKQVRAAVDLSR